MPLLAVSCSGGSPKPPPRRPPASLSTQTADVHAFEIRADAESGLSGSFNYTTFWKTGTSTVTGRILVTVACGYPGFDVTVLCSEVITHMSVALDQYGRMSGTFRYSREGWDG
jgi:hypothetical protein